MLSPVSHVRFRELPKKGFVTFSDIAQYNKTSKY